MTFKKTYLFVSVTLILFIVTAMAQDEGKESKSIERKISRAIKNGDYYNEQYQYPQALEEYLSVYGLNNKHLQLNLKIGLCYLYSSSKYKCLPYFETVYEVGPTYEKMIYFYLARGYQLNYQFEKAISYYQKHEQTNKKLPENESLTINKRIEECRNGARFMKRPCNLTIENLGGKVNTPFPEYRPLVATDGSLLLFTATRGRSAGSMLDPFDDQFYEDIFMCDNANGKWLESRMMGNPINTPMNDAISGMSHDGKSLVLYNDHTTQGDLYISEFIDGKWSVPERLPLAINSRYVESTSAFSPDKKTLYFVSQRTDLSIGMKDIYMSIKNAGGKWSEPKNLGPKINTRLNEEAISMHPNGKLLFFSSEGHSSMGGYDVFVSQKLDDGSWGDPVNLGYPLNTPDDDMFFTMSGQENVAYYSTIKDDGFGNEDIYKITFDPDELFAEKVPAEKEMDEEVSLAEIPPAVDTVAEKKKEALVVQIPEKLENKLKEKSIQEMYAGLQDAEIVDLIFETETLDEQFDNQKEVLDKARILTNILIGNKTLDIGVLKNNPTKVIVEIVNTSSSKGMEFMYPSGGRGTFVLMLPHPEYGVELDIEDVSVVLGKSVLVSSAVQKELVSNNIIAVDVE